MFKFNNISEPLLMLSSQGYIENNDPSFPTFYNNLTRNKQMTVVTADYVSLEFQATAHNNWWEIRGTS